MLLDDYLRKEKLLAELEEEVEAMRHTEELQKELAFRDELLAVVQKYGRTAHEAVTVLAANNQVNAVRGTSAGKGMPSASSTKPRAATPPPTGAARRRTTRPQRIYINPFTKEELRTRGSNHKRLKEWKDEYGPDVVEGWRTDVK